MPSFILEIRTFQIKYCTIQTTINIAKKTFPYYFPYQQSQQEMKSSYAFTPDSKIEKDAVSQFTSHIAPIGNTVIGV